MTAKFDYQETKSELDQILVWFESEDINIEEAILKYQKAEKLIDKLQKYLDDAKARVEVITKS